MGTPAYSMPKHGPVRSVGCAYIAGKWSSVAPASGDIRSFRAGRLVVPPDLGDKEPQLAASGRCRTI